MGKGPELVFEDKKLQLDIVGLTLIHSRGTAFSRGGWTLLHLGVANSERLSACTPIDERVAYLCLGVG